MKAMTMAQAAVAMEAEILQGDPNRVISSVCIDTRKIKPGELFFALKGERFDGHEFVSRAAEAGAAGVVLERPVPGLPPELVVLRANDSLAGLQSLARHNREQYNIPVVGVTGSSGKTTTKDMVAAVLGVKMPVLKTIGNFNNEIGLPLTLLDIDPHHRAVVAEMAMRGLGEIDALCQIARPTGAVITNIGEAHFERLGSVENIARAKGEILDHIPAEGFAILNGESPFMEREARRCKGRVLFYGMSGGMDIIARDIRLESGGNHFVAHFGGQQLELFVPIAGRHNVMNALAALGVGWQLGLSGDEIARGLANIVLTGMRLEVKEVNGITIINDAYNANPSSAKAALQVLKEAAAGRRTVAVLGNMLELGERAVSGHREVGEAAAGAGVQQLLTVGGLARHIADGASSAGLPSGKIYPCENNAGAVEILQKLLQPGDVVLVKGSRGMKMEEIVNCLLKP